MYWLTTRHYNPKWGRFIILDAIEYLDPSSINGMNLYAYCGNNPINKYDPTGHFVISTLICTLTGTAALVIVGTITYGAVTDSPVVIDLSGSFNSGAGVGYKVV